jgi:hypothetical protein
MDIGTDLNHLYFLSAPKLNWFFKGYLLKTSIMMSRQVQILPPYLTTSFRSDKAWYSGKLILVTFSVITL